MLRTLLTMGAGALLLSTAVVARTEFGRLTASPADLAPARDSFPSAAASAADSVQDQTTRPMVVAQVTSADAAPAPAAPTPASVYMQDQQATSRIDAQIDALMTAPNGGFAVQYYAKPAPPPEREKSQQAKDETKTDEAKQSPDAVKRDRNGLAEKYVIARAGDTVYATLDRAFNSDDPQAPIFATIRDVDNSGIEGPLDGVRMIGNIVYSSSQGTIQFNTAYLPDGRPVMVKGIAVSEDTARTGIAKNVDTHDLERYGSLLFATLAQGAGQVGQILLQNNQQASVDPNTGLLVAMQKVSPYQAALAGLLPTGQALTAAAAQGFNRPATISGPAGMGLGIVFLEPVVVPGDVLFARNR